MSLPNIEAPPDRFLWRHNLSDTPREFSSSITWNSLQPTLPSVPWHQTVWFSQNIPKHAFLFWVVVRDCLPSRDRLRRWGLHVPSCCLLCGTQPESRMHLFFDCDYSQQIWISFVANLPSQPPVEFSDIVTWAASHTRVKKLGIICKLLLHASVYEIWKERNSRLHNQISTPTDVVSKQIRQLLRSKLAFLDSKATRSIVNHVGQEESYLSNWFRNAKGQNGKERSERRLKEANGLAVQLR